jgi:DNA-binding transcriptional regulator YiaG
MGKEWRPLDVAALRDGLGMTQEAFARALDVTVSTVNRWENGHSKPSKLAKRVLDAFEADLRARAAQRATGS